MHIRSFTVSPWAENCLVVHDGGEAALIDPGTATREERQAVINSIEEENLRVRHLLLTHAHIDHVFGAAAFERRYGETAEHGGWQLHPDDRPLLKQAVSQGLLFGIDVEPPPEAAHELEDEETIELGSATWTVRHTPGHAPGHVVFIDEANGFVVVGDVLFKGSIGRTDLPGGDHRTLIQSIEEVLMPLPDETIVYPGHGPQTTIGEERRGNPFLQNTPPEN